MRTPGAPEHNLKARRRLKEGLEVLLFEMGPARLSRLRLADGVLVLAYHNIVPHGDTALGERSLHLPQARFAEQLDLLMKVCDVVPLTSCFLSSNEPRRRPRVAITFDDAYRGAVTAGVEELAIRGLPATLFVSPHFVLSGQSFWWDSLAGGEGVLAEGIRDHALHALRGSDARIRRWAEENLHPLRAVPEHSLSANEEELAHAQRNSGITFAAHTWTHPNLASISGAELRDELERPLDWLRERFVNVVPWISYPYGLSSPDVETAAAAAGYIAGLRIDGGWMKGFPTNPFAVPRFNVSSGISSRGFGLRASGLFAR